MTTDPELPAVNRVIRHAVLGDLESVREVTIWFEDRAVKAREGEPILSALVAAGVGILRYTKKGSPRRMFCGIGRCTDCVMTVDGVPGVRTCVTAVRDGMRVERQEGVGRWAREEDRDGA